MKPQDFTDINKLITKNQPPDKNSEVSCYKATLSAINKTKQILFNPFCFSKWISLGFIVWIISAFEPKNGFNLLFSQINNQSQLYKISDTSLNTNYIDGNYITLEQSKFEHSKYFRYFNVKSNIFIIFCNNFFCFNLCSDSLD